MPMLKRAISYYRKFYVERLEEKGVCQPSSSSGTDPFDSFSLGKPYVSDTSNGVGDVSIVVSQTNSEHCWPELVDLLVGKPPSNTSPKLLSCVALPHENIDASVLAGVALDQTSPENSSRGDSINKEWIFVMANFLIELMTAVFDQLSSVRKPRYALIAMLMSFIAAVICIIELAYKAGKERVTWRWGSKLPWFYYSSPTPSNKRFGTFPEIIGLICAILQSILSAIVYTFYLQHADYPIKISFWPLVFALGLLFSKFTQNPDQKAAFRRD